MAGTVRQGRNVTAGKLKRRLSEGRPDLIPPDTESRRRVRLASEPTSRHLKRSDRWEEGFLRLPGGRGERALSYVVDELGIYNDATTASTLEALLEDGGWETPELLARAEAGIAVMRRLGLSLDNDPRRLPFVAALRRTVPEGGQRSPVVAVVDQPRSDRGVGFDLAGPARFEAMLHAASSENPGAAVVVVADPASWKAGEGHLERLASRRGVPVLTDPVAAHTLVESCGRLYTVSSFVGFEAALAGVPVTCFGVPFYAGWGFTDDRLTLWRRTRKRDPVDVFAAAFLVYSRYFDPYDGTPCSFEEALGILTVVTERDRENAVSTLGLGFARWKVRSATATLSAPGFRPVLSDARTVSPALMRGMGRVVAWASRMPAGTEEACREAGVPLRLMEDGFLRSIGLGVGLRPGASYVLDSTGVYYDATRPSDLETLLETASFPPDLLARAARLRAAIVRSRVSKYNVGAAPLPVIPKHGPVVLVAGQVENDASIRLGLPSVDGNAALLRRVRERNPGAVIAYKPHPDVEAGLRPGRVPPDELADYADIVLHGVSAPDAIEAADSVEVMTSLMGFEALLRGKAVTTHGVPFYAGWGLTQDPGSPRRTRRLTLDELVAGALILYPRYIEPRSGLPCSPEVLVDRLAEGDPDLTRREPTLEAGLKEAWSVIWRKLLRRTG